MVVRGGGDAGHRRGGCKGEMHMPLLLANTRKCLAGWQKEVVHLFAQRLIHPLGWPSQMRHPMTSRSHLQHKLVVLLLVAHQRKQGVDLRRGWVCVQVVQAFESAVAVQCEWRTSYAWQVGQAGSAGQPCVYGLQVMCSAVACKSACLCVCAHASARAYVPARGKGQGTEAVTNA